MSVVMLVVGTVSCGDLFVYGSGDHRELHVLTHSFPTRRSSDLTAIRTLGLASTKRQPSAPVTTTADASSSASPSSAAATKATASSTLSALTANGSRTWPPMIARILSRWAAA